MNSYKKIFFITLAAAMAVILFIAGKHLLIVVLTTIWLLIGAKIKEAEKNMEIKIKNERERQEELLWKEAELVREYEKMAEFTKRRREQGKNSDFLKIILITLLTLPLTPKLALAEDDLYIPTDYNELKELYILADQEVRERDELIAEYQALVGKYKDSVNELNELVAELQEISREKDKSIGVMKEIIESHNEPGWGIGVGLALDERINYNLGIIRLNDWWGWQVNYISSGSLLVGLNMYF